MAESSGMVGSLSLTELIRGVQNELIESQREREEVGQPPLFIVDSLVLEVNFVVTKSKAAHGGVDIKVVSLGGEAEWEKQQVHKVTLTLDALPFEPLSDLKLPGGMPVAAPDDGFPPGALPERCE